MSADDIDPSYFVFSGTSTIPYSYDMKDGDEYGRGYIDLGRRKPSVMFFRIRPNDDEIYRNLIVVKSRTLALHHKALLIPLVIARNHNGYIDIGFGFEMSFQDFINSGNVPPLFKDTGELDPFWFVEINKLFDTIIEMHGGFLYHCGLGNISSYVIDHGSVCIVTTAASTAWGSKNPDLEKDDLVGLGTFLDSLDHTGLRHAADWTDFIEGFGKFRSGVVKHHPVIKDGVAQYGYIRSLLTRVHNLWDLNLENFIEFQDFIKLKFGCLAEAWNEKISGACYQKVFDNKRQLYKVNENISMLLYIENAMKHVEIEGHGRGKIAKELNDMFPGVFSLLHTTCATHCASASEVKIFPEEN